LKTGIRISYTVAPVRERGLKSDDVRKISALTGRSREGAWIEIATYRALSKVTAVAPVRERGLKWNEWFRDENLQKVAPVRERGLKLTVLLAMLQR